MSSDKVGIPADDTRYEMLKSHYLPYRHRGLTDIRDRPVLKANRAGTRGFRAPEVLFKCPDQTVGALNLFFKKPGTMSDLRLDFISPALDIWSAGTILLCVLGCKFPIFTASDDVEALMELAAVYGRRTMEKCGKLHSAYTTSTLLILRDAPVLL